MLETKKNGLNGIFTRIIEKIRTYMHTASPQRTEGPGEQHGHVFQKNPEVLGKKVLSQRSTLSGILRYNDPAHLIYRKIKTETLQTDPGKVAVVIFLGKTQAL